VRSPSRRARLIAAFRNTYAGMFPQIGDCCPDGGICESCALLVEKAEAALDAESAEPETGAGERSQSCRPQESLPSRRYAVETSRRR
jgi:hypothetical protein